MLVTSTRRPETSIKYIGNILSDAGSSFKDIVHLKVHFKYDSQDPSTGIGFADRIMEISKEVIDGAVPVLTAFGVDLLYPGLNLEIDAMAIIDADCKTISSAYAPNQYQPAFFHRE
jgi:enamine deaminase RidA (YjgF/YER057c/UK114 family)